MVYFLLGIFCSSIATLRARVKSPPAQFLLISYFPPHRCSHLHNVLNHGATVSALFRTSLTCVSEKKLAEPEIKVESLSPQKAADKAAFASAPFPRIELDPPTVESKLPAIRTTDTPAVEATVCIVNGGGLAGAYHVCTDNRPAWLTVKGATGTLAPGEKAEMTLIFDAMGVRAAAANAVTDGIKLPAEHTDAAYCVLMVEVDGGGVGAVLPVVCRVAASGGEEHQDET